MDLADNIPYHEYRVIRKLKEAHIEEFGNSLRAILAFGPLVTGGNDLDIELLEIIDKWQGPLLQTARNSSDLPLRAALRLYTLPPAQLADPESHVDPKDLAWVQELIKRVLQGFVTIYQAPGYNLDAPLDNRPISALGAPPSGSVAVLDPMIIAPRHEGRRPGEATRTAISRGPRKGA